MYSLDGFAIHIILFINWSSLSYLQNIRKFAHLYRFIKNISQFFGVDLNMLLKNVGWNITRKSRFVYRELFNDIFTFSSLITLNENEEFSAACWDSLIFFILQSFWNFSQFLKEYSQVQYFSSLNQESELHLWNSFIRDISEIHLRYIWDIFTLKMQFFQELS